MITDFIKNKIKYRGRWEYVINIYKDRLTERVFLIPTYIKMNSTIFNMMDIQNPSDVKKSLLENLVDVEKMASGKFNNLSMFIPLNWNKSWHGVTSDYSIRASYVNWINIVFVKIKETGEYKIFKNVVHPKHNKFIPLEIEGVSLGFDLEKLDNNFLQTCILNAINEIESMSPPIISRTNQYIENKIKNTKEPISFGYKTSWMAFKTDDNKDVLNKLKLDDINKTNWAKGLEISQTENYVFVSQSINGWVLVHSLSALPLPSENINLNNVVNFYKEMSKEFGEVQIYATHRVIDLHTWGLFKDGEVIRAYGFYGEKGKILWNIGDKLTEENDYEWPLENSDWEKAKFPSEADVLRIASKYSINTLELNSVKKLEGSCYVGKFSLSNFNI